jgi:copper homeostasis protein
MLNKYKIEIATVDYPTTLTAIAGGADRVELCGGLSEGGLTPSYGLIRLCCETLKIPLFPIIRSRGGDFLYDDEEFKIMHTDVRVCKELGCAGVVVGLLLANGKVDKRRTHLLMDAAYPMEVTFHRAFDRCIDPFVAMEELIKIGVSRILTSGQQPTALEGASLIKELVAAANGRITIVPGSGVRPDNIRQLAESTGATEFHASLRKKSMTKMKFLHPSFQNMDENYMNPTIDVSDVKALVQAVAEIPSNSTTDPQ